MKNFIKKFRYVKDVEIVGTDTLRIIYLIRRYEIRVTEARADGTIPRVLLNPIFEVVDFELKKVTAEELVKKRREKISFFILKIKGELFYTEVPKNLSLTNFPLLGRHLCGTGCKCVAPGDDSERWCPKIREGSTGIEKYPWIITGYETVGTSLETFVVAECECFKPFI